MSHPYPTTCDPDGAEYWKLIPEHLQPGLTRYFDQHVRPGAFLSSLLANDFQRAMLNVGDTLTLADLRAVNGFLIMGAPHLAYGAPELFERWIASPEVQA